jgi:pyruvate/2-oxoacid:ferredoxin oxidoreductase beta subunit
MFQGIADGMKCSAAEARTAVDTGYWPLYRHSPPSSMTSTAAAAPDAAAAAAAAAGGFITHTSVDKGSDVTAAETATATAVAAEVPAAAAAVRGRFVLDSKKLKGRVADLLARENRFSMLARRSPAVAAEVQQQLQKEVEARHARLQGLASESKQQQQQQ